MDDGSTDNTWKILQNYRKQYPKVVRIYRFDKNQGESKAANFAYTKTKGELIARMDADDLAHPTRLAKQVAYLKNHLDVIVLGTQAKVIDGEGRRIGSKNVPRSHEDIYKRFAFVNAMIHPSVMFQKSLLPKRLNLYRSNYESTDDYDTYFELLNYGKFANLPEELMSYRIHGTNKSLNNFKEKYWTDSKVRINAVRRFNYHPSVSMFPAIAAGAILVLVLPETWLKEIFFYLRGVKKLPLMNWKLPSLKQTKNKIQYALAVE